MFQENGVSSPKAGCCQFDLVNTSQPFTWNYGQARPTQNPWSWTNLSSVLYVDQPVGTGFSQGIPDAMVRIFVA
jgi:carboxypeptidase D